MRVSTNVEGLDQILRGGLISGRSYLIHGPCGSGKTTVGFHFLSGADRALLVTFGEPEESLRADAKAIDLDIGRIAFLDLTPVAAAFGETQTYDIFSPSEVERESVTQRISATIEKVRPQRIFVDGFHLFRDLAADPFHYHRLVQSFFKFATLHDCTLLLASDSADAAAIVDGIIQLDYTRDGRFVRVTKFRGSDFHAGPHPMRLTGAGVQVLPDAA